MSIRLPGLPDGIQAERICHGSLVGENEYELHGKRITKGGRFAVSAVVVTPKPGWQFVQEKDGRYRVEKSAAPAAEAQVHGAD